ncbi:hypothetical protein Q7P35_004729 [Cladosporium inversicolor]
MDRFNGFLQRDSAKKASEITINAIPEIEMESKFRKWKPITFRRPFLLAVTLITLGILALVQVLVIYDQRHSGILFATKISELGAGYIFLYRYFPTIISVSYGLIWNWIDVDARRIEPYRQLSKPGGASGSNSLLLHYPTDLLAFVPLKALRRKHWPVVLASSALVLVGMGLTPLQAAIFATERVTKFFDEPMLLSTSHMSMADQASQITANYTYSVANIVWLGERLPQFMTREAAFTPFKLETYEAPYDGEVMTAETTSYAVDVKCEPAVLDADEDWISSQGCKVPNTFGPPAPDIIGESPSGNLIKEYSSFFAGYSGDGGNVNYYLASYCPDEAINVFMVALRQNRKSEDDSPANTTRLFCETAYYQQSVTATIRRVDGSVINTTETAPRTPLSPGFFNTTIFQDQISNARQQIGVRGSLPTFAWPDQRPQLSKLPLTISGSTPEIYNIFGLAVGAYPRPLGDYMDPEVLTTSFGAAYQLLFARAMVDVLAVSYEETEALNGTKSYMIEAVRVLPKFAYAVEAILGVVIAMAITLMVVTWRDALNLCSDPDSLSALMFLTKGQPGLLEQFSQHDQSSWALLKAETSASTYELEQPYDKLGGTLRLQGSSFADIDQSKRVRARDDTSDFDYPIEFSMVAGIMFVLALLATLAGTAYLYQANEDQGLALPTQNRFVRQLLENYIPTVVATLIEPVWVVLNRHLCLFQPFEELYKKESPARRSINLKYSSIPPQLVVLKALHARHFILSAVCTMALLANVLAVAFSGLLDEDTLSVGRGSTVLLNYEARLKEQISNGTESGNPFPFYYAMANFTSGTPMPQWTSDSGFYLPVSHEAHLNQSDRLELSNIPMLTTDTDCNPINHAHGSSWRFDRGSFANESSASANMTVSMLDDQGETLSCATKPLGMSGSSYPFPCDSQQVMALELMAHLVAPSAAGSGVGPVDDDACRGLWVGIWARKSASALCEENAFELSDEEVTAMVCRAKVVVQSANVTFSGDHYVLEEQDKGPSYDFEGSDTLIKEITEAMWLTPNRDYMQDQRGTWHNDSFPSDWNSFVMNLMSPDSGMLDPTLPPPSFNLTAELFKKSYRKLFAILMGMDHERLLAEAAKDSPAFDTTILHPEIRIVVSKPMIVLSSTILGLYIIVAIAVYAHRPGKFLPRMPLTMASDIALFAASQAVTEIDENEKAGKDLSANRKMFGYGSFIGTDGRPHVGVERAPFVVPA